MNHLKTIESLFNSSLSKDEIKKFIVMQEDDKKYSILKVFKKNWSLVDLYVIYYYYRNSNRLVKCKDEKDHVNTYGREDILKNIIFQSDDLKEIKMKIPTIINTIKFNI